MDKKNKIPIIILGIILGVGFLISTVTTIPYVDAQESSLNESDDVMQYMAPLRQIRDDGVSPQDVKCNDNKILVFKIKTLSPACIQKDHFPQIFERNWITKEPLYLNYEKLSIQVAKQFVMSSSIFADHAVPDSLEYVGYSVRDSLPPLVGVEYRFSTIGFTFDNQSIQTDELVSHNFYVGIRNWNEVHRAIIDDVWDELNQKMVLNNEN